MCQRKILKGRAALVSDNRRMGGRKTQPPEHELRDSARKVVRGLDGKLIVKPLVWTARVVKLRVGAEERHTNYRNWSAGIITLVFLATSIVLMFIFFVISSK